MIKYLVETTLSVCGADIAVVPLNRAVLALETAAGAGLSLMLTHFT